MADNLNIKNPSVTEDALDLRTDSSGNIVSISGHSIAGGAGGGNVYFGDDEYIQFKTGTTNTFTLTSGVKDTIDHIPQTVATEVNRISYTKTEIDNKLDGKQDKLTFEYDEANKVSAINGSALAGQGGTYYRAGTDIIIDEYNNIKVNTNGSANSTGMAFVEGMDNIASGFASHAEGLCNAVYSDYSHIEGYNNTDYKIDGLLGSNHIEGAYNKTSGVYSHNEGHANEITGYGVHVQGGYNKFYINNVSADTTHSDKTNRWNVWGISIEGMANATTAEPTSGSIDGTDYGYIHGGILKVIGNGTRTLENPSDPATEVITRSDALIIYRDGSISAAGNISANGVELGAGGGGGTSYQGRNGVKVDGGYIELTTTAYESVTSVPNISNDVNTLKGASGDWNKVSDKLDTTAFSTVSGDFLTEIPNEYVTSSNVTTQDADYVMTTTGWKVLTLPGGGMTQVIHDETLTGQGNDANSKLGVAWTALSGNTINSALSAGWAVSAKGANTEYKIGTWLDALSEFRTDIITWSNEITGSSGIEVLLNEYDYPVNFHLTETAYNAITSVSSKLDTTAAAQTYQTKGDYVKNTDIGLDANNKVTAISGKELIITAHQSLTNYYTKSETSGATEISTALGNKVDKPSSLIDKYLALRTDNAGNVSGWVDLKDNFYSKTEATGTFVATANIDTTTLSGDGKSVSTKLGVKTDVIATRDYVNSSFLPLSGGTVSGTTIISGSSFDTLEVLRSGQTCTGTIGINGVGGMSLKIADSNSNNTQLNIDPTATMDKRFSIGDTPHQPVAYFIPAVTSTTTAGLTNDGILHIIVES